MKDFMDMGMRDEFGRGGQRGHHHGHRGGHHPGGHDGEPEGRFDERGSERFERDGGPGAEHGFDRGPAFEGRGFEGRGFEGRGFEGRGGRGRRGGFGPRGRGEGFGPGFGGPMGGLDMGPMGEGRGPRGGRGGRRGPGRGRKGDVRNAVLALLREQELNGYGVINAIAEKTDGLWRPGAGSVYPALGLLEDEGLIAPAEADGKKVYRLTEAGQAHVAEHADELENPWDKVSEPHKGFLDVRHDMHQLGMAVQQVVVAGDQDQLEATRKILERARKDVYRLLAGDADEN